MELADIQAAVLKEEEEIQFSSFSNATAYALGSAIVDKAAANEQAVVVSIMRNHQCIFLASTDGASVDHGEWLRRKHNVVAHFGRSSYFWSLKVQIEGFDLEKVFKLPQCEFSPTGGAFPITIRGTGVVGSVGFSGLHEEEDHAVVVAAMRAFMN